LALIIFVDLKLVVWSDASSIGKWHYFCCKKTCVEKKWR